MHISNQIVDVSDYQMKEFEIDDTHAFLDKMSHHRTMTWDMNTKNISLSLIKTMQTDRECIDRKLILEIYKIREKNLA